MTDKQLVTLTATIGICCLHSIETLQPEYSKKARLVRKVKEAIQELAMLTGSLITEEAAEAGTQAWNTAMKVVQEHVNQTQEA